MGDFHNIFKNLRMQNHYTQGQMADPILTLLYF